MKTGCAFAAVLLTVSVITGADNPAVFDAASIKPASIPVGGEGRNRCRIEYSPKNLTMLNVALSDCVQWAYGVAFFQISGTRTSTDSYDILARTGAPVQMGQLKAMLRDLLAKRFNLTLHRETRTLSVYELAVAKNGPKLPTPKSDVSVPAVHGAESLPRIQNNAFLFQDVSMPEFAATLMQLRGIDLPIVDHTRIQGTFDLALKGAPAVTRDGDTAALFAIIQEQLGLRLTPTKAPIEMVVIDHAEKPSGN